MYLDYQLSFVETAFLQYQLPLRWIKNLQPNDTLYVDGTVIPEKLGLSNETLYIMTDHKNHFGVEVKITILGTQEN